MDTTAWTTLRDLLVERYDDFKVRLTRRFGSADLACESLQETWLRLERDDDAVAVENPSAYVMRTAVNVAIDRLRDERRQVDRSTALAELEIADPAPDPARKIEDKQQLAILKQAIDALPERSRRILIAARLQGLSQQQIADRFGLSTRMVRIELRRALDSCAERLDNCGRGKFLFRLVRTSIREKQPLAPDMAAEDDMESEPRSDDHSHG